jgi:uncharacterized membrane protein
MKMNNKWVMPLCIGIMLVVSAVLYPSLPAEMPVHWNLKGEVDGYAPKGIAVLLMPAIATLIAATLYIVPKIDPRRESYEKFASSYERIRIAAVVYMQG